MEMDSELADTVHAAQDVAKEIDGELDDLAWRLEKQEKAPPPLSDLSAYVAHRAALEDLRHKLISLRIDKAMALITQENARTRSVRRNLDRTRAELSTMIDDRLEARSAS